MQDLLTTRAPPQILIIANRFEPIQTCHKRMYLPSHHFAMGKRTLILPIQIGDK